MLFTSESFLFLFLPVLFIVYFMIPSPMVQLKNLILVAFSIVFYTWGERLYVALVILEVLVGWFAGKIVYKRNSKTIVAISVALIVGLLFYFKYYNFFASMIANSIGIEYINKDIHMPLGISFITFQVLSYIIDCYRRKHAPGGFWSVMLYISMFPQLIAGPIVRYSDVVESIKDRENSRQAIVDGLSRFSIGLMKKVLLANQLAYVAENCFEHYNEYAVMTLWIGSIAYTLQIYFDFSGYSDMAIGIGRCFGFSYPENFNKPYCASSITDFWRRWHMTLSGWFRDYVYIPLGGNRCGKIKTICNLLIVWALTGLWHGANWTFVVWGLVYFALLSIERFLGLAKKKTFLMHIYTLLAVNLLWIVFNSDSLSSAGVYLYRMFGGQRNLLWDDMTIFFMKEWWIYFVSGILFVSPILRIANWNNITKGKMSKVFVGILNMLAIFLTMAYIVKGSYNPFIYFNF